jgi:hypothetical protein
LLLPREKGQLRYMKKPFCSCFRTALLTSGLMLFLNETGPLMGAPKTSAVSAFNSYSQAVEFRLARQHRSLDTFLAPPGPGQGLAEVRLRRGELTVERLTPSTGADLPGALLHHWRGTTFVPGGTANAFERLIRDVGSYPQNFSPQVLKAGVVTQAGDRMQACMRVRQRHVITVVLDTTCDITFGRLDVLHRYSISRSTRIAEIDSPGTSTERALDAGEEHGFLWRLNTYWSYEERDGGLYLQIESLSLSRSIPPGLGWAIRPYVESIPRESLVFTLRSASSALRND